MGHIIFIAGIVIALGATVALLVFAIRECRKQQAVKDMPLRLAEWKAQYRTRRGYILVAQLVGLIIASVGVYLS